MNSFGDVSFVLIGRNGLLTSIALEKLANQGHIPKRVWIEKTDNALPALTERVCRAYAIPFTYSAHLNQPNTADKIMNDQPAFGVVAGLGTILKETLLDRLTIVNLHIGALPFYRGAHVNFWKMKANEDQYEASLHRMEREIDSGIIFDIAEAHFPEIDGFELMRKNYRLAGELLCSWLDRKDKWEMVHSNSKLEAEGTYYPIMKTEDFTLDVEQPVHVLYKQINRLRFYGAARLKIGEKTYKTSRAELLSTQSVSDQSIAIQHVSNEYVILHHPTGLLGLHLTSTL